MVVIPQMALVQWQAVQTLEQVVAVIMEVVVMVQMVVQVVAAE